MSDHESTHSGEDAFRELDARHQSTAWKSAAVVSAGPGVSLPLGLAPIKRPFFEHQKRALRDLDRWWEGESKAGVLCLPTGGGKTRTACGFVLRRLGEQVRTLWLAHRVELVTQAIATFAEASSEAIRRFDIGRYDAQAKARTPVDVLVASIPTLARRSSGSLPSLQSVLEEQQRFHLVVVDECHHGAASSWAQLIEELQRRGARVLGLSATPTRTASKEAKRLWKIFGQVVYEEPLLELIRHKVLSRPRPFAISTRCAYQASDKERKDFESFGDLPTSLIQRISDDIFRNDIIVDAVCANEKEWGQTIVFSGSIDQSRRLAERLNKCNIAAASVNGTTRPEERQRVVEAFRRKEIKVVTNVNLFTEGTDLPNVETVLIARPTRSRVLFQQMVGRGMRGPRVGGSATCNIVMFHDEVQGLLEQTLASTFTSEREALEALDIESLEMPPAAIEPTDLKRIPVPQDDTEALLRYLEDASRSRVEAISGAALAGWWEARTPSEVAYLPVFQPMTESSVLWINELRKRVRSAIPEAIREALPICVLETFRDAAEHPRSTLGYVAIEDGLDQLQELTRRLRAVDDQASVPEWWQAVSIGEDAVVFEDDEGAFVFSKQSLDILAEELSAMRRRIDRGAAPTEVTKRFYEDLHSDLGLTLLQFQRLALGALRDGRTPDVRPPNPVNEEAVLSALRVVPRERQSEVVIRALEGGLSARYESASLLVSHLLADMVGRRTDRVSQLMSAPRFVDRVSSDQRETVGRVVAHVIAHGGVADVRSVARVVSLPEYRVPGFAAGLGENLNVDGYRVVTFDAAARELRIDADKLFQLFEVS